MGFWRWTWWALLQAVQNFVKVRYCAVFVKCLKRDVQEPNVIETERGRAIRDIIQESWKHITHVHVTDIGEWLYRWHIGDCGLFQFFPYVCFRSGPTLKIMSNQGFWYISWDALEIQSTFGVGDVTITPTGFSPGLSQQSWRSLSQNALSLGQWLSNFSLQINHLEAP